MKNIAFIFLGFTLALLFGFYPHTTSNKESETPFSTETTINTITNTEETMKLGAFSVSLSVKDLKASKEFYEHLGFTVLGGAFENNYLIMKNENSLIGLFQGMFENNILTFNPGWDENGTPTESFDDIRDIQRQLQTKGVDTGKDIAPDTNGPASFMITDPDGNVILLDQHR